MKLPGGSRASDTAKTKQNMRNYLPVGTLDYSEFSRQRIRNFASQTCSLTGIIRWQVTKAGKSVR